MAKKSSRKKRQEQKQFREVRIEPKNEAQEDFLDALETERCLIVTGPAGTGKTFLSCCYAANKIAKNSVDKIILTRPLRGVGDSAGFLPGNMSQKMGPWCRPLVDVFKQHMSVQKYEEAVLSGKIEISPIEHIRGLTFDNSIMILDEAQNMTITEMKAVLTRIGYNTQVIVLGDLEQSDLWQRDNGLAICVAAVEKELAPIATIFEFTYEDIVRSDLCKMWAVAFTELCKNK